MRPALLKPFLERPLAGQVAWYLLAGLVLAAPLLVWPAAKDSFVLPKSTLLHAATFLLLGAALARSAFGSPLRLPLHPVNGFLLLWVLWQGATILWSKSPWMARDQFADSLILLAFVLLLQSTVVGDRRRLVVLGALLALASIIVALWVLVLDFRSAFFPGSIGVRQTLGDWRDVLSTASFGNTSHVADFLVMGFLVALGFFLTSRRRVAAAIWMPALWLLAAALIVSWSVHSNASLIVAAPLLLVLLRPWRHMPPLRRRTRLLVPLAAGWIVIIAFFTIDQPLNPHHSRHWRIEEATHEHSAMGGIFGQAFSSPRWKEGGPTRLAIWLTTLEMIRANAWLGVGAGNFTFAYPATTSELVRNNPDLAPYAGLWTNAAHNEVLQVWSEQGIVGLMLLVAAVGAAFHAMGVRRRYGDFGNAVVLAVAIAMLVAWCLQAQMNFPMELPVSSFLFVVLLSVPAVLPQRRSERDLLMPVWRDFPGVRLGIMLKNMQRPTELHAGLNVPRRAAMPAAVLCLAAALFPAWLCVQPLRSDVQFRPLYEGIRRPGALEDPTEVRRLEALALRTLEIDPRHVDARSALSDLYVRTGQYAKALEHLPLVRRRLNAVEVFVREAVSLDALGRPQEALRAWDEVFRRHPQAGGAHPGPWNRWLRSQQTGAAGQTQLPAPGSSDRAAFGR